MKTWMNKVWSTSPALTGTGLMHGGLLVAFVVLALVDGREVSGALVWVKPAKFAASILAYTLTLAWMLSFVTERPVAVRRVAGVTAAAMWIETVLISLQAGRGVRSHFNAETPWDGAIYSVMGLAILAATVAGAAALWLLFRQRFEDRALAHAVRMGLLISLAGALVGGLMTQPSTEQIAAMAEGSGRTAGAHAVGVADGGRGLPVLGWSTEGGDLRVPHFVALHAMQVLPLVGWALFRRRTRSPRSDAARMRLVHGTAAGYAGLFGALLWQALRGEPLLRMGSTTLASLGAVAVVAALIVLPSALAPKQHRASARARA